MNQDLISKSQLARLFLIMSRTDSSQSYASAASHCHCILDIISNSSFGILDLRSKYVSFEETKFEKKIKSDYSTSLVSVE